MCFASGLCFEACQANCFLILFCFSFPKKSETITISNLSLKLADSHSEFVPATQFSKKKSFFLRSNNSTTLRIWLQQHQRNNYTTWGRETKRVRTVLDGWSTLQDLLHRSPMTSSVSLEISWKFLGNFLPAQSLSPEWTDLLRTRRTRSSHDHKSRVPISHSMAWQYRYTNELPGSCQNLPFCRWSSVDFRTFLAVQNSQTRHESCFLRIKDLNLDKALVLNLRQRARFLLLGIVMCSLLADYNHQ